MMNNHGLSIIIPTYNEETNIRELLRRVKDALTLTDTPYEIIIVDDHSTDNTRSIVEAHNASDSIRFFAKTGKKGKGFSILEGASHAQYSYIAMLDADLQYPPEILPELFRKAMNTGFAVANRKVYNSTKLRKFVSRANAYIFGKLLLSLHTDIQSGLKIFRRDVFERLDDRHVSAWAIDIPLIHTAYALGLTPSHVDIEFNPRDGGLSKVNFFQTPWEIAYGAIKTRLSAEKVHIFPPHAATSMQGSGFAYKRKRFTTHTTLHHRQSALVTVVPWQKLFLAIVVSAVTYGMLINWLTTAVVFVGILSAIYFIDVLFNLYVVLKSLHFPPEIQISDNDASMLDENSLPLYTVLCPLYREANVLPQFVDAMNALDWPKNKLEVLLLLEEDDTHTIQAAEEMNLPSHIRIEIVPHSEPKTKPKASNYGLSLAKGEYIVVFDAEDKPEPSQIKKSYLAFSRQDKTVVCLQAKLNYYNPHHNLLTRLFTAEYSLWFDVILPGLQSINTTIPLGGTSNHFRTEKLKELEGWDPFNVTEDCDLGARLFARGYKTAIIDSTTMEEANSDTKNWFRQRSRWIKGYIQTYLVQMRNPVQFIKRYGWHSLIFQLIVGGRISFMIINPLLWAITISYFTSYWLVGPTIEALYPTIIFYMAVTSLVFGNFIYLYNYMIGCAKREHWGLIKYTFFIPFYWLMMSISAVVAVYQLIFKPHYWEKTIHGLHLFHDQQNKEKEILRMESSAARGSRLQHFADLVRSRGLVSGGILIAASLIGNLMNFGYNAYLGRSANLEDFGVISLIGSFLYIAQVPLGALSKTITHKSAFLLGKHNKPVKDFWLSLRRKAVLRATLIAGTWLILSPLLQRIFNTDTIVPFVLFTPVWIIGSLHAIDYGYLGGNLKFTTLALISVTEAVSKLLLSILFVELGLIHYVYAAVPLSMACALSVSWLMANRLPGISLKSAALPHAFELPGKFFTGSLMTSLASISYLSLDLLLAKYFLPPEEAGAYSFLTLAGKMVYFLSNLFGQFTIPLISRDVGANTQSKAYANIFALTLIVNTASVFIFGIFGYITVPLLWGPNAAVIVSYLPVYTLAMAGYAVSGVMITYQQVRGKHIFPTLGFLFSLVQILGMMIFHAHIGQLVTVMAVSSLVTLTAVIVLDLFYDQVVTIYKNGLDFLGLFGALPAPTHKKGKKLRILIFNWRDLRHKWSGGAEVYIHQLAKRWVSMGHKVTVFSGNDQHSTRYETMDGVRIIRRGGFYTVYVWAFLYYMRFLRRQFDIIVDSENGLPFFTPLYAKEKVYLLIHHVHQEVFRNSLRPPFSWLAQFLERRVMPLVYRNTEVITVSPSSKSDILDYQLTKKDPQIIYSGVDLSIYKPGKKNKVPTVLYLGRLTTSKSLSVLIDATERIRKSVPKIKVIIAGDGPDKPRLMKLATKLSTDTFTFLGKVTEQEKIRLYQEAWVFVNPSLIEGWGITTIEANACGTPVVASNVAGLRDAVHNPHSGLLVPYGNVEEFATNIVNLLTQTKTRKQMSRESIVWARKFDWDKSARESISIFNSKKL